MSISPALKAVGVSPGFPAREHCFSTAVELLHLLLKSHGAPSPKIWPQLNGRHLSCKGVLLARAALSQRLTQEHESPALFSLREVRSLVPFLPRALGRSSALTPLVAALTPLP